MSAPFRVLKDLFKAFDSVAPGRLNDPGDAGTITPTMWGQICSVVTATDETRTLAAPTKPGILVTVVLDEDGGDLTLSVTNGYNADGNTAIVFDDAQDFVTFISIKSGGDTTNHYWRVLAYEGTNVRSEDLTVDQLTATTLSVTGATDLRGDAVSAEHGAGAIGTATAPSTKRWTENGVIITEIQIDLTGLASKGTENDIIGLAAGGAAIIGRNVIATNGYIFRTEVQCLEVPLTGDADVIFVIGSAADEEYDGSVTDTAVLADGTGDWGLGEMIVGYPDSLTANYYYYMTQGATDGADTYTAGKFVIRTYGRTAFA